MTATGTDLTYQWYKDSVAIAGATTTSYALATPTTSNAGKYYVVVTNSIGFAASTVAVLTVVAVNSGSNTSLVVNAANAFLATLNTGQQTLANSSLSASTVLFANTLSNARTWTDTVGTRHGLRLNSATLSVAQLNAADALIAAALSSTGALLMSEIRLSDDAFAALNFNSGAGSGLYSIAFIGQPSTTQLWTLQLTGHQLTYNITYNTPLPSATPMFIGAQPPNWTYSSGGQYTVNGSGTSSGTPHAPMETQRVAVSSLASALVADSAVVSVAKLLTTRTDLLMGPTSAGDTRYRAVGYPTGTSGRGVLASKLSTAQQAAVQAVIQAWVNTQATDVAQTLLDAYLASDAFAATYVAYAPGTGGSADFEGYPNAKSLPGSANNSYLRIDGPRVWIEFIVASMDNTLAGYVHYRSVWRDKTADYGGQY